MKLLLNLKEQFHPQDIIDFIDKNKVSEVIICSDGTGVVDNRFVRLTEMIGDKAVLNLGVSLQFPFPKGIENILKINTVKMVSWSIVQFDELTIKRFQDDSEMVINNYNTLNSNGVKSTAIFPIHPSLTKSKYDKIIERFFYKEHLNICETLFFGTWNDQQYPESYNNQQLIDYNLCRDYRINVIENTEPKTEKEYILYSGGIYQCDDMWTFNENNATKVKGLN